MLYPLTKGKTMRLLLSVTAVCLCLGPIVGGPAVAQRAIQADPQAPAAAAPSPSASDASGAAAAARHARRTACLKQAKAKKLLGADKTSFIKQCTAAP
jgi:predicted lipid-binding transport protein (Tim44 family)